MIHLIKKGFYLAPADKDSLKKIKKLSKDILKCEVKVARNYEFHKRFFAMLNLGYKNTSLDMPFDTYRKVMIMKAGYFKAYSTGKGTYYEPDSISFDKMSEIKFREVHSRVLAKVAEDIGLTNEELEIELLTRF